MNSGFNGSDANYIYTATGDPIPVTSRAAIIDDVDSVTVGVNNVNIEVQDLTENIVEGRYGSNGWSLTGGDGTANNLVFPKSEIYTVYHRNGYVIAAVTIGEGSGTNSKIAYFPNSTSAREEDISDNTRDNGGYWTWQREAIVDGEWVTLTVKLGESAPKAPFERGCQPQAD